MWVVVLPPYVLSLQGNPVPTNWQTRSLNSTGSVLVVVVETTEMLETLFWVDLAGLAGFVLWYRLVVSNSSCRSSSRISVLNRVRETKLTV